MESKYVEFNIQMKVRRQFTKKYIPAKFIYFVSGFFGCFDCSSFCNCSRDHGGGC